MASSVMTFVPSLMKIHQFTKTLTGERCGHDTKIKALSQWQGVLHFGVRLFPNAFPVILKFVYFRATVVNQN
jgi:hypothetical protein